MEPLVSIIVPVYNAEKYLRRCLGSIAGQTFAGFECILVDDGSTDGSPAICDEWAAKDGRFRVIHQKNGGASAARNAGIEAARAPWLLFADADDALAPDAAETLLAQQTAEPGTFVVFAFTEEWADLGKEQRQPPEARYRARDFGRMYADTPLAAPWGKLFEAALVKQAGLRFDVTMRCYEDRPFVTDYLRAFFERAPEAECLFINRPLYYYENGNAASLSKSDRSCLAPSHYEAFDRLLTDCLQRYGTPPEELTKIVMEYMNTLLYGAWCTPAKERRRAMARFYKSGEYCRLMGFFKQNRLYEARYLPLRFHATALAVALDQSRLAPPMALYWKFHWLGLYTLCRGWTPLIPTG